MDYQHAEKLNTILFRNAGIVNCFADRISLQGERGVLLFLYREKKTLYSGELVQKLGLTTGRMANILKKLEERRLVERTFDADDRRRVRVALTEEGARAAEEEYQRMLAEEEAVLEYFGEQDTETILRLAEKGTSYKNSSA